LRNIIFAPILWGFFLTATALPAPKPDLYLKTGTVRGLDQITELPDTLKILAIRVEFQLDTLSTTRGDGTFGSGIPDTIYIDKLPHNRTYFEDHLTFLRNYFTEVSGGNIVISDDYAVFPQGQDDAYTLPNKMWHYNYNSGNQEDLDRSLAELFIDAWSAAAEDTALDVSNYNVFIIYHAGIGQDFDVGFDQTPHDIPSAYFRLEDLQDALDDPSFQGVDMGDGQFVNNGILLPECEFQPEAGVEIAMNGTEVLLFGHWLGLPALYNTDDGTSGVGRFDFMDQGSGNFAGMIPSRPCAWTREFMGWVEPFLLDPVAEADTFQIKQVQVNSSTIPEVYRIPINENEYYLIENRAGDPEDLGYTYAYDREGRKLRIEEDYDIFLEDGDFGVIVDVDNYDFGLHVLPDGTGEGVLIWHIDQTIIDQNYATNSINNDINHKGVRLVEADGSDDIGRFFGILQTQDLGWWGDFWFAGNDAFLQANPELNSVRFFSESRPASKADDGSLTGIQIGGFTPAAPVMNFWVRNNRGREGFPKKLAGATGNLSPSAIDYDSDGQLDAILTLTTNGAIQLYDRYGDPQESFISTHDDTTLLGEQITVYDTLLAKVAGAGATPAVDEYETGFTAYFPGLGFDFYRVEFDNETEDVFVDTVFADVMGDFSPMLFGSGPDRRILAGSYTKLIVFDDTLTIHDQIQPLENLALIGMCLAINPDVFVISEGYGAAVIDWQNGTVTWDTTLPFIPDYNPIHLQHQADQTRHDLVVVDSLGDVALLDALTGDLQPGFPMNVGMPITAPPTAGDFDNDGYLDIILMGENRIAAVQVNGTIMANWPYSIDNRYAFEPVQTAPLICEFNDELHIVFGWTGGSIDARSQKSDIASGFPLSTGSTVMGTPLLVQLDDPLVPEGAESELIVLDEDGALFCWNMEQLGQYEDQRKPWNGWMNGNNRQGFVTDVTAVQAPETNLLVTTKVYPWPNPAKDKVYIRYKLGKDGDIKVRIFDGAGDLVKELKGSGQAGFEQDLEWDLNGVSSGVYLGRVEATGSGKSEHTFIKIAVIK